MPELILVKRNKDIKHLGGKFDPETINAFIDSNIKEDSVDITLKEDLWMDKVNC